MNARRFGVGVAVLGLMALVVGSPVWAGEILVPNAGFEEMYKPGSTTITAVPSSWTTGVGPNAPINGAGGAEYSDGTNGPDVNIPGWIGNPGWPPAEDPTSPVPINEQGAIQSGLEDTGLYGLGMNGSNWGAPNGNMVVSAASLASIESGLGYTFGVRMALRGGTLPVPLVWDLLADGVALTPSSSVAPDFTDAYQSYSKTYDAASLIPELGKSLTIRLGVGHPSSAGSQMKFDNVTLSSAVIPEPSTLVLGIFGLLGMAFYGFRRKK